MKKLFLALSIASLLGLAACGGRDCCDDPCQTDCCEDYCDPCDVCEDSCDSCGGPC